MLVFSNSEASRDDDDVVLRDRETGRVLCIVNLIEVRGTRIRWGFTCPPDIEINRLVLDNKIHPAG